VFAGQCPCLLGVFRKSPFAVDVGAKRDISKVRQHFRALFFVIRQTHPLMHDQNAGAMAKDGIIVGDKAFERRVPLFVFDGFGVDGRARGESTRGYEENAQ
jgi:hypothetical protein